MSLNKWAKPCLLDTQPALVEYNHFKEGIVWYGVGGFAPLMPAGNICSLIKQNENKSNQIMKPFHVSFQTPRLAKLNVAFFAFIFRSFCVKLFVSLLILGCGE